MAITFSQLESRLTPEGGMIDVSLASFQSPKLTALSKAYFVNTVFTVNTATMTASTTNQTVTVVGTLANHTFLGLIGASVKKAVFTLSGGVVSAVIEITTGSTPVSLSTTFFGVGDGLLGPAVTYHSATFTLNSEAAAPDFSALRSYFGYAPLSTYISSEVYGGLSLSATFSLDPSVFTGVGTLLTYIYANATGGAISAPYDVVLSGEVANFVPPLGSTQSMSSYAFRLSSTGGVANLTLGSYTLSLDLELVSLLAPLDSGSADNPTDVSVLSTGAIGVTTKLTAGTSLQAVPMSMYSSSPGASVLNFKLPPDSKIKVPVAQLSALFDNQTVAPANLGPGSTYPGYPAFSDVYLNGLSFRFDCKTTGTLQYIDAEMTIIPSAGSTWSLFGGMLEVQSLGISLSMQLLGASPQFSSTLNAQLAFSNQATLLAGVVHLPNLAFDFYYGSMIPSEQVPGQSYDLSSAYQSLIGHPVPSAGGAITCSYLNVGGNIASKEYYAEALILEPWKLTDTDGDTVQLSNVYLRIEKNDTKVTATGTGQWVLKLGDTSLTLVATIGYDSTTGWAAFASLNTGQISLKNLFGTDRWPSTNFVADAWVEVDWTD